jgi:branched-chain amino acid transport system ATP-binding protein
MVLNEDLIMEKEFYLGGAGDQRKSFKNLKSFKRRKRSKFVEQTQL